MRAILDQFAKSRGYTPWHELTPEQRDNAMRLIAEDAPSALAWGLVWASAIILVFVCFVAVIP